jgi:cold shock CspA family protein/ribosome-associated translation inhibitor RaiA
MQVPLELTFEGCEPSDELRDEVERQMAHLEKFSQRVTSCHVIIHGASRRHRQGGSVRVDVRLAMPQGRDVIVNTAHGDRPETEHPKVAIAEAFAAARRRLEDAVREMRGDVKTHVAQDNGKIARFLAGQDCGFIETADGREVYFHRNAVLTGAFGRLKVGDEVRFVEDMGDNGPQASTVELAGGHRRP